MPRTTGNARPPDGHGRSASDNPVVRPDARAEADDDNLTSLGDLPSLDDLDATVLPTPSRKPPAMDDATRFEPADDATRYEPVADATRSQPPDDATRFEPADDATRFEPADDATQFGPGDDVTRYEPVAPQPAAPRPRPSTQRGIVSPRASASTDHSPGTGGATSDGDDQGPLVVGQAFGPRYKITRVLGVGGMGAVYQAWDAELGVDVAVKVIRPEIAADPAAASEIERRFKRELLLARQVTHPNIIRIHDLGDIDGIKYITMPFIEGSDLATILKQEKKLGVPQALKIARGTVSGLVSAHQAGVIHRDLKPANIMIGWDDVPTIMDFGIARSAGGPGQGPAPKSVTLRPSDLSRTAALAASSTMAGAIVGTVAYMAPEQARGEEVDQRVDIYAFGLILYDMIVGGRRSERAPSAIAELQQRMQTAPPPPRSLDPSIPEAVDEIIRRCLEPDAAKRFQTTVELQHALDRLDEQGKPLPIMKRVSRRAMIAAAVMVVALITGAFYSARWLSAPVIEPDPMSVVIADFQNNTGDEAFDHTITQTVRRALESASFITAFDRTRIRTTFSVPAPDKFDDVAARELAIKQGLSVVLAGSIGVRGNGYEISVVATQPLTGETITTVTRRASSRDQVLDTVTTVASNVRRALGDQTSESVQSLAMRSLSTTSFEVTRYYAAAVEAQARSDFNTAFENYAKTVELDPTFGLGYHGMAIQSRNLGRLQDADKYGAEALRFLDSMTERERFSTRGNYYYRAGDYGGCVREYGELIAKFPADVPAHNGRAICLSRLRDFRGAVDEMRRAVKILPNHSLYRSNLAAFLIYAGEFAEAEQEIRKLPDLTTRMLGALAFSQLGQGLVVEAGESYRNMAASDAFGASFAAAGLADLAFYEGRFSDAVRIYQEGVAADLAVQNADRAAQKLTALANVHLARGQDGLATATAERALQHSKAAPVRFLAGRVFIEAGNLAGARALAAEFADEAGAERQAFARILEGGIALKAGKPHDAIKLLMDANGILDTWLGRFDLGRAFFEAGQYLQADSEFDRCIQRRGEALAALDEDPTYGRFPIVYYYQGRVREELKTARFGDSYREYLKIRGDSTDDRLVAEIHKRIAN